MTSVHNDRLTIVSADTHAGADRSGYRPYLDAELRDEFDAWSASYETDWSDLRDTDADRNWDSAKRLALLEADGIAAEVVFPNTIPPFFPEPHLAGTLPSTADDYRRRWAGLRAHNRWLVDFCAEVPGRRRGIVQIFPNDVDDAVQEITWAIEQPELCGVLLPSVPPNTIEPLYDARYDPIWQACADASFPVTTHAGGGAPTMPDDPATLPILIYEYGFWTHRTLWHLVLGGVFDRFPEMRYVLTEQGGPSWLSRLMTALDDKLDTLVDPKKQTASFDRSGVAGLSLKPSEFIARNCWLGASFCQPHEMPYRDDVGVGNIMWGADFPHREGTTPHTREALRATFAGLPADEVRAMLGGTAIEVYGFDADTVHAAAARIGPTAAEIDEPLLEVPADATTYAFHPEYVATY